MYQKGFLERCGGDRGSKAARMLQPALPMHIVDAKTAPSRFVSANALVGYRIPAASHIHPFGGIEWTVQVKMPIVTHITFSGSFTTISRRRRY